MLYVEQKYKFPSELDECRAYWTWAQHIPKVKDYLYKIVNEGKRSPIHGRQLKFIGLRRGVPDYHYPVPNDSWYGLWIEMKTQDRKKSYLSDCQKEWIEKLRTIGHYATSAHGWSHAAEITMDYIENRL